MPQSDFTRHFLRRWRNGGFSWLADAVFNRVFPARPALRAPTVAAVAGRSGLEIGGPSRVFRPGGLLPVYGHAARMDNVNFTGQTAWESGLQDGGPFAFSPARPAGRQYLREAADLRGIADGAYDFVASSHCLEHSANPLRTLREWKRVTRRHGHLVVLVPDPARSFDHRRPVTSLAHLQDDLARGTGEDDLTHLEEILALHDLSRDPLAGTAEQFAARSRRNFENRCLHQHVFDLGLLQSALTAAGWTVLAAEKVRPVHLIALAENRG